MAIFVASICSGTRACGQAPEQITLRDMTVETINPFAAAGWSGYPACRLAAWEGGAADGLIAGDIQRLERLQSAPRREDLRGSLVLRRQLVSEIVGCDPDVVHLGASDNGAPQLLTPEGWQISLSNKDSVSVVAMAPTPALIGVDLERLRPLDWKPILSMTCSDAERADIEAGLSIATDPLPAFFRMWTLKEAVLKCTQQGFRAGPKRVETPLSILGGAGTGQILAFGERYEFWSVDRGDLIISLARKRD